VTAKLAGDSALWRASDDVGALDAYEIHMGHTVVASSTPISASPFVAGGYDDGCASADGLVVGTYMHGLLENPALRRAMLTRLAERKGRRLPDAPLPPTADQAIDALADAVAEHLDLEAIGRMVGLSLTVPR
jgi:adenosylcobyric acid synthase